MKTKSFIIKSTTISESGIIPANLSESTNTARGKYIQVKSGVQNFPNRMYECIAVQGRIETMIAGVVTLIEGCMGLLRVLGGCYGCRPSRYRRKVGSRTPLFPLLDSFLCSQESSTAALYSTDAEDGLLKGPELLLEK